MSEKKRDWTYVGRFEIPKTMQEMMAEAQARSEELEAAAFDAFVKALDNYGFKKNLVLMNIPDYANVFTRKMFNEFIERAALDAFAVVKAYIEKMDV